MSVPTPTLPEPSIPYAAPPDGRPKGLGIAALVIAVVGFVMACIPFVAWFAGLVLLAALVLAIVALANRRQGGKGFSIAGLVISVVGGIVALIVGVASLGILGTTAWEQGARDDVATTTTEEDAAEPDAADEAEPAAEPVDEREDLVLVGTAFGRTSYDPTTWWYVAIFENPNEDYIFSFAGVSVEALDAAGTILDSSSDYRTILSGRTAVSGTFFSVGQGEIASLSVRGPEAAEAIAAPASGTGGFTIAEITPTTDDWSTSVTGKVTSTFADDQELVEAVVIARNAAGAIIAAEFGFIERLPTGGTAQFEVRFIDPLPGDTVYEAYAVL